MWLHTLDCHSGIIGQNGGIEDYRMIKLDTIRSSLRRQTEEGVRIRRLEEMDHQQKAVCLNSKLDFVKANIKTMVTHCGNVKETPSISHSANF